MKKIILLSAVALMIFVIFDCSNKNSNCSDYSDNEKTKTYEYLFGPFGDEEGAGIRKQAKHFKISKLLDRSLYKYQPKDNFIGFDSVEISVYKGNYGDISSGYRTNYKITFHITQCGMKTSKTIINK